jgi:hypothetical protein
MVMTDMTNDKAAFKFVYLVFKSLHFFSFNVDSQDLVNAIPILCYLPLQDVSSRAIHHCVEYLKMVVILLLHHPLLDRP